MFGKSLTVFYGVFFFIISFDFTFHRFYVENITQLKDIITVELFYLNAKSAVYSVSAFSYFYSILKQCKMILLFSSQLVMIHCLWTLSSADNSCRAHFSYSASWNVKQTAWESRIIQGLIWRISRGYSRATQSRFYVWIWKAFSPQASTSESYLFFILFVYYVSQGIIEVESDNVFKLAANALQVSAFNSLVNMH